MKASAIFVMCLHGLDILSRWVLFFSLLCATASAFQYSHLAKDLEVFVTKCTIHGHVLQEWTRCVFLKLFIFFVPTMFSGILGSFVENSTVVYFPLLVCTQTQLEVCVVERIVARSVLSPEFFLFSASVCVHGSTKFVSSSLSYVAVSRSREKQLRQASA